MPKESAFVETAHNVAKEVLQPPLSIRRGAALLYAVTVDNNLSLTVDPKHPVRGDSAFQTDLCVFEAKSSDIVIPRVVLEFKTDITIHDVLTYSAKARKHKQVYPYLRYGLIVESATIPRRFFVHNESLDFFAALAGGDNVADDLRRLLLAEVNASQRLEDIGFGSFRPRIFRTDIQVEPVRAA